MANQIWSEEYDEGLKIITFDREIFLKLIKKYFDKKELNLKIKITEDEYGTELLKGEEETTKTKIYETIYDGSIEIATKDSKFIEFLKSLSEDDVLGI